MPIYQIILVIAVVILVLSLLLNLLFSPITWIIIAILVIYSFIRRYLYEKQLKEYNERIEKEMHAKDFGNARTVRTLLEKVIDRHAVNIIDHILPETDRYVLQQCDMPAAGRF